MRALAVVVLAACTTHAAAPIAPPAAGISIALYDRGTGSYGVVDDRRWVDVTGSSLVFEHIDPGAALASLVIEPYDGPAALQIAECTRERFSSARPGPEAAVHPSHAVARGVRKVYDIIPGQPAPAASPALPAQSEHIADAVRCAVLGAPGRYLVRILYVSTALGYRAQHEVTMTTPERARVTTRFAIATPVWHERADVTLFDGAPGGDHPPSEVAHGSISLDGSTAILEVPPRDVPAQLRRVFDGAVLSADTPATDPLWGRDSQPYVWVWLELEHLQLASGSVRVHVALPGETVRDVEVPATGLRQEPTTGAPLRLPLWIDETLRGMRQRYADLADRAALAERFLMTIANVGDTPREVWVEEHLRPAHLRRVERAWPSKPVAAGDVLRSKLVVRAGRIERVGYTVAYAF